MQAPSSGSKNGDKHNEQTDDDREGTTSSARFNILATMVGGGCLSLPLALHQAGNAFFGPLLLVVISASAEFSVRCLLAAAHQLDGHSSNRKRGRASLERVACAAFGPKARYVSMGVVSTLCFCSIVGCAVLLRDFLIPLADYLFSPATTAAARPTAEQNGIMLIVVLLITPLTTLQNLTPLRQVGAASMASIFTMGCIIAYRSAQCNFSPSYLHLRRHQHWMDYLTYLPASKLSFLDALPIIISVFLCHFNALPVYNELKNPTSQRVSYWIRSSFWSSTMFYLFVGFSGSMYGNCTASGAVEGNVMLSFDEADMLVMVGRVCMVVTIGLAFPVLVIPCRDTILRAIFICTLKDETNETGQDANVSGAAVNDSSTLFASDLTEPLLLLEPGYDDDSAYERPNNSFDENNGSTTVTQQESIMPPVPRRERIISSILICWTGALVACNVSNIDLVWGFLGSSLSIIIGFFIPCGSFLVLVSEARKRRSFSSRLGIRVDGHDDEEDNDTSSADSAWDKEWKQDTISANRVLAWLLIAIYVPIMVICTTHNAYNTFL